MGGRIAASSPGKGKGSQFFFEISAPVVKNLTGYLSCTALVLDDDTTRRDALANMLRYSGVSVLRPSTVPEASPSIIFALPSLLGTDQVSQWRQQGSVVCIVAPHILSWKPSAANAVGPDLTLKSPVDVVELRACLKSFTDCNMQGSVSSKSSSGIPAISDPPELDVCVLLAEDNHVNHTLFIRLFLLHCRVSIS